MKAITVTTVFKKALKTVLDTLTATEQKNYDVGIGLQVDETGGIIIMEHPVEPITVTAKFSAELEGEDRLDCLFYLGELVEDLKHFRKKEALYIDARGEIVLSVEDGMFYRADPDTERIAIPTFNSIHDCKKSDVIQMIGIGQAVSKTTFHPSTSVLQVVMNKTKLFGKSTNFAQLAVSKVTLETASNGPVSFDIPAKWLTKVRYVLERDKKPSLSIALGSDTISFVTKTTQIIMKQQTSEVGVNAGNIMKQLTFSGKSFAFGIEQNQKDVKAHYETLRQKEDDKADDEKAYQTIGLIMDGSDCRVSTSDRAIQVATRDLNSLLSKLDGEWNGKLSEKAIKLSRINEGAKHTILIPYF